jgi:hypothetical protein
MGKLLRTAFVASLAVLALGLAGAPAAQAAPKPCTGPISNTRIGGDVTVPGGATCTLSNVVVGGRVTVQPGGNLILLGSTLADDLDATTPASIRIDAIGPCSTTCAQPSIIRGNATINGATSVPSSFAKNYICNGTKIGGDLAVKNSGAAAPWNIGGSTTCSFGGNKFNNNVVISGNASNVTFANNRVANDLSVSSNTGGGSLVNNSVGGHIGCNTNTPPYTASGNTAGAGNAAAGGTC